jgi:hypothetical protein
MNSKFFACILAVLLASCQQNALLPSDIAIEGGVPEVVVSNFYSQFPDNKNVVWTQLAGQSWFVKFNNKVKESGAFLNDNGHILGFGVIMGQKDLPANVFKNLQNNVPNAKILNVIKALQNPTNADINDGYVAAVQQSNRIYCVKFNDVGNFVSITPRLK